MTIEFEPWPKIARLNRDCIVTEKIDGTNAAVVIVEHSFGAEFKADPNRIAIVLDEKHITDGVPDFEYHVFAQSRTRFITPEKGRDNYGFAAWVKANAEALVSTLGPGRHFGEWWGAGIQRGYGLTGNDKRFSLFNVHRWAQHVAALEETVPGLSVVPVLYEGLFSTDGIDSALDALEGYGSFAVPDFDRPEGIVVWHDAARLSFKVTLEGDEAPKGAIGHARDQEKVAA
jgi:hypothetical protein